jgi:hypothetical protein
LTSKPNKGGSAKSTADERRSASVKYDEQFFKDRKVREEKNLALTLKLRAQRMEHEAKHPKPSAAVSKRTKKIKADD